MSPARSVTSRAEPVDDALDRELCYRALRTRDARFDGRFFTAVISTGIYCRPVCPARTPKVENCLFVPSAAAAQSLGFRPCLRCRPEAAPGAAIGRGSANTVARALHLIASGSLAQGGLDEFAERLGIGTRQLRRLFDRHVGASPVTVAQTQRLLFAKQLLLETTLPLAQIAGAAGFGSVRRFNAVFQQLYTRTPSQLRGVRTRLPSAPSQRGAAERSTRDRSAHEPSVELKLSYTPPYDFTAMLEFLEHRAIPGVETVQDGRYVRAFMLDGAFGTVEVRAVPGRPQLTARIRCTDIAALRPVVARLRRMFDLDADSTAIDGQLARHPALAQRVLARPGIRVPGAWDAFELAVRALLGQQVSVAAATTFADRIVQRYGSELPQNARMSDADAVTRLFPSPEVLANASFEGIGLTRARCAALQGLARHVADDAGCLQPSTSLAASVERLCQLPGIGEWTAHYIALRALGEPDAFPVGDLGLARALAGDGERPNARELSLQAEVFRPFRAYATLRLWLQPQTSVSVKATHSSSPPSAASSTVRKQRGGTQRRRSTPQRRQH